MLSRIAPSATKVRKTALPKRSLLDTGDEKFPNLRNKADWNHVQISFTGPRLQVRLNGTKICDVTDNPTDPAEAAWKEAGPISFQWPHGGKAGLAGFVKLRNLRIREL